MFDHLRSLNIKWYQVQESGLKSPVIERLAQNGHFQMLDLLYEVDEKGDKVWSKIDFANDSTNPLVGVIEGCLKSGNGS